MRKSSLKGLNKIILGVLSTFVALTAANTVGAKASEIEEPIDIFYCVSFYNGDQLISSDLYLEGEEIVTPANPVKASDKDFDYSFAGWTSDEAEFTSVCSGNVDYYAVFDATVREYNVAFVDYDGTVIATDKYQYGDTIQIPNAPVRVGNSEAEYKFIGWDKEIGQCMEDIIYYAKYLSSTNTYTITYLVNGAKYHVVDDVAYGTAFDFDSITNEAEGFSGWTVSEMGVTDGLVTGDVIVSGTVSNGKEDGNDSDNEVTDTEKKGEVEADTDTGSNSIVLILMAAITAVVIFAAASKKRSEA